VIAANSLKDGLHPFEGAALRQVKQQNDTKLDGSGGKL
jgi:hypothetical protein